MAMMASQVAAQPDVELHCVNRIAAQGAPVALVDPGREIPTGFVGLGGKRRSQNVFLFFLEGGRVRWAASSGGRKHRTREPRWNPVAEWLVFGRRSRSGRAERFGIPGQATFRARPARGLRREGFRYGAGFEGRRGLRPGFSRIGFSRKNSSGAPVIHNLTSDF